MVTFRNNNNNVRRNNFRRNDRNFKSNGDRPKFNSNFSNNENFKRKAPGRFFPFKNLKKQPPPMVPWGYICI